MLKTIKSIVLGSASIGSAVVTLMLLKHVHNNGFAEGCVFAFGAFLYVKLWECAFE